MDEDKKTPLPPIPERVVEPDYIEITGYQDVEPIYDSIKEAIEITSDEDQEVYVKQDENGDKFLTTDGGKSFKPLSKQTSPLPVDPPNPPHTRGASSASAAASQQAQKALNLDRSDDRDDIEAEFAAVDREIEAMEAENAELFKKAMVKKALEKIATDVDAEAGFKYGSKAIGSIAGGVDDLLAGLFGPKGATTLRAIIENVAKALKLPFDFTADHFAKAAKEVANDEKIPFTDQQRKDLNEGIDKFTKSLETPSKSSSKSKVPDFNSIQAKQEGDQSRNAKYAEEDIDEVGPDADVIGIPSGGSPGMSR